MATSKNGIRLIEYLSVGSAKFARVPARRSRRASGSGVGDGGGPAVGAHVSEELVRCRRRRSRPGARAVFGARRARRGERA